MTTTAAANINKVIVVGAGPVGLLTALILGQQNIPVDVVEARSYVDTAPRGLAYGPAAVSVFRRAGLIEKLLAAGAFEMKEAAWRDLKGNVLASRSLEAASTAEITTLAYAVGELSQFLARELQSVPSVRIHWSHKLVNVGQDDDKAWIEVEGPEPKRMEADFIVAADGGSSGVRHSLFGHNFPGYTWPVEFVAVNLRYDMTPHNWSDIQWVIDPEQWALVCKLDDKKGLWRVAYGEKENTPIEEIRKTLPGRLQSLLPGRPTSDDYEILGVSPYRIHQRLIERMRVGRVLFAGDAAHLNNPMGGLGLTSGVADVGALTQSLIAINQGITSIDILDKYDELRRAAFKNVTDVASTTNLKRIWQNPDELAADPFFISLAEAKTDAAVEEELKRNELAIASDMSALIGSGAFAPHR